MDERLDEDGQTQDLESAAKFKLLSEKYAFQSPSSSPTRRPGKPNTEVVIPHSRASSPRKRKPTETEDIVSPEKAKRKRGYAPPETYSHLNYLTDCLAMNLEGAWPINSLWRSPDRLHEQSCSVGSSELL